jgi:hypothetical protein
MKSQIEFTLKVNRIFLSCIDAGKYQTAIRIAEKYIDKRELIGILILSRLPKKQKTELEFESIHIGV